jgi:PAS domain S-box-containing protein
MDHTNIEAERFRTFISRVTDYAIYLLAPDGTVMSWNAGAERFKGYLPSEIIGKHFSTFYTAADKAAGVPERALRTARETGKFEDEGWRVRKDGTMFWASVVLDPIFSSDNDLLGYTKITRDITDKRKSAEQLHASEEQFRLLVQSVTDYAIYMLSPEGIITNWNEGAKRIKGLELHEVVDTHFSRFYTPEDRAAGRPARALATARKEGRYENEGWRVRGDGTTFWAHVVIDPVYNPERELIGFAKITRDITERRNATLTLEKTREALFQAQKMEAIGKLTGGIAHDFNNLLSVVGNGIALLRVTADATQHNRALDSMERAAQRGNALTKQLLAFARQQPLKFEKQDANRILASFEAVLRRALPSSATITFDKAPVDRIMTDVPQLESAVLNLVINARDACSDSGNVYVTTRMAALSDGEIDNLKAGSYVVLCVSDDGAGMSAETKARAFEPFFTTKAVGKGTGLGLSQVYGLMQQSNGTVTIASDEGFGTAISLYFPVAPADEMDASDAAVDAEPTKALIVDDQADVLDTAVALFQNLGYEVLAANCGTEALALLDQHPDIELLFSDIVMPGLNGIELARAAKQRIPKLKVVLATGYMAGSLMEQFGAEIQEFEVITKPYSFPDLLKKLHAQR